MKTRLSILALIGFLSAHFGAQAAPLSATIQVNSAVTLNTFAPISIFGGNVAYWMNESDVLAVQPKIQAAGNFFLRYPGGSSSDDFHWNGSGVFDSNGWWTANNETYLGGFQGREKFRGTTSSYGTPSNLTDGNLATTWLSCADTDFPNAQWMYVDLASNQAPNAVTLTWGSPYATQFTVQYWPLSSSNQWSPYQAATNDWLNTSAVNVIGTGGTQGVTFIPVATRYLRILMKASSVSPAQYSLAEFYAYNGATQLTLNTTALSSANQPTQSWCVVSSTDLASSLDYSPAFDFEAYMAYLHSFSPQGIPMITVNFGNGTPAEAAAWVHYANIYRKYGIKYWQIGNENEGSWETGGPLNTQDYVRRYIEFCDAMKAEDPGIIITGPVAGGFMDSTNLYNGHSVIQDFISLLHAQGKDAYISAIDFHWYPNYGNYANDAALASTSTLDTYAASLQSWLSGVANASTIPVLMTEFNVDPGDEPFQLQLADGLFTADALGHFIKHFGNRGFTNLWCTLGDGGGLTSTTGGGLGYLQVLNNAYRYQAHATYWAMKLMTNAWSLSGDASSHALVSATSNQSLLTAYADYRPDQVLSLMVVNKDPTNSYAASVSLEGFSPNASANAWRFDSTNYVWETTTLPYHAAPDTAPTTFIQTGVSGNFPVTFGPYSITVLQFTNALEPTNTITATPTITQTPTPTATVYYNAVTLIDDFEDPARDGVPPARTNLWGGPWEISIATNSSITVAYGSPGAASTNRSALVTGVIGVSPTPGWSNYETHLAGGWPPPTFDVFDSGLVGVQFWFYGDGANYRVCAESGAVTDSDYYGFNIKPPAGVWTFYQYPFSSMTRQGWGGQTGLPTNYKATDFFGLQFKTQDNGAFSFRVDQVAFYNAASGSPIPTATVTRTGTVTNTPTITPTPTITYTPTETGIAIATGTPTATVTPSATPFPDAKPVLWPNPVKAGKCVNIRLSLSKKSTVKVRAFSLANRLLAETDPWDQDAGLWDVCWPLADSTGTPLANGLYYLLVDTPSGRTTLKLVVLK